MMENIKKNLPLLSLLVFFFFLSIVRGRQYPLHGDIFCYGYGAKLVSQNGLPTYKNDFFDDFGLITEHHYLAKTELSDSILIDWCALGNQLFMSVPYLFFGELGFTIYPFMVSLTALLFLYAISSRLFNKRVGLLTLLFFELSNAFPHNALWPMADMPSAMFLFASYSLYAIYNKQGKGAGLILSGFLLSCSFLIRHNFVIFIPVFLLFILTRKGQSVFKGKSFYYWVIGLAPLSFLKFFYNFFNYGFFKTGYNQFWMDYFFSLNYFPEHFFILLHHVWASFSPIAFISFLIGSTYLIAKKKTFSHEILILFLVMTLFFGFYFQDNSIRGLIFQVQELRYVLSSLGFFQLLPLMVS